MPRTLERLEPATWPSSRYTTPATTTDHIVGLRFSYAPAVPAGVATLTTNTFTGAQAIDAGNLDIDASTAITGNVTKNGTLFLHNFGLGNTFLGLSAGNSTLFGSLNVGVGDAALTALRSGSDNRAVGWNALSHNTTGGSNTALGMQSLWMSTSGNQNTAAGWQALQFNTGGDFNTAIGAGALRTATANQNTAVGNLALISITTGGRNVAIGSHAGENSSTGFDNIYIGTNVTGAEGETKTIYLGAQGTQTHTFIAGIRGITTGVGNAVPVVIDSNGQLGTVSSSIRFKEDVHDMGGASQRLLGLRPVTFRYAKAYANGDRPIQFGLVAEEVADVFPELAVRNADGQVETVHYETLSVLLLNELQRQEKRIDALQQATAEHSGPGVVITSARGGCGPSRSRGRSSRRCPRRPADRTVP